MGYDRPEEMFEYNRGSGTSRGRNPGNATERERDVSATGNGTGDKNAIATAICQSVQNMLGMRKAARTAMPQRRGMNV